MNEPRSYSVVTEPHHNQHYLPLPYAEQLAVRYRALYGGNNYPVKHGVAYCSAQTANGTYCFLNHEHEGHHVFSGTTRAITHSGGR